MLPLCLNSDFKNRQLDIQDFMIELLKLPFFLGNWNVTINFSAKDSG